MPQYLQYICMCVYVCIYMLLIILYLYNNCITFYNSSLSLSYACVRACPCVCVCSRTRPRWVRLCRCFLTWELWEKPSVGLLGGTRAPYRTTSPPPWTSRASHSPPAPEVRLCVWHRDCVFSFSIHRWDLYFFCIDICVFVSVFSFNYSCGEQMS